MATAKEAARELIERLPEEASWDDIMYELYVKQKIDAGLQAVADGRSRRDELRELDRYIRSHEGLGQRLPNFPGRAALSSLALRAHELLRPRRYRLSASSLGNRLRTR